MRVKAIHLRHGAWNIIEHAVTRGLDAFATLALLWVFAPERFSEFALAQAWVAPWLLLFISPESVIYRDFSKWKSAPCAELIPWLRLLRKFGRWKAVAALALSAALGATLPLPELSYSERTALLVWAFFWVLSPQISGADREFLRLELRLPELTGVSVIQRLGFIAGLVFLARSEAASGTRASWLHALLSFTACFTAAMLAEAFARARLKALVREAGAEGAAEGEALGFRRDLWPVVRGFGFYAHLNGVILNWVSTMDLFFMGLVGVPARALGAYSFALKLANFSHALPMALSNVFGIWVGRKGPTRAFSGGLTLARLASGFALVCAAQALVLWLLGPWLIALLSRGRFDGAELLQVHSYLGWILAGAVLVQASFLFLSWKVALGETRAMFLRISLPWILVSLLAYGVAVCGGDAPLTRAAMTNVAVGLVFFVLGATLVRRKGGT